MMTLVTEQERIPHGTSGGYTNHDCRCSRCTDAFRRSMAISKKRRVAKGLSAGDERHGTQNGYGNYGCRCEACTEAHRVAKLATRRASM